MKICFIDASSGTVAGGTETIVSCLARTLCTRHDVSLITGVDPRIDAPLHAHLRNAPFEVVTLPFMSRANPRIEQVRSRWRLPLQYDVEAATLFLGFLRNGAARRRLRCADVVSLHYPTASLLFSQYTAMRRVPSVFHTPGHVPGKRFFRFDRATLYLGNSHDTDRRVAALTGRRADGVVTPGISWPAADPRAPRDTDRPLLLNVSRLLPSKGIYRLLRIFARVQTEIPGAKLLVVGKNYEGDRLREAIAELGLSACVELHPPVPHGEVGQFYARADLLVHPSMADSFGMVLVEAMAHGLPVAATRLACFEEAGGGHALLLDSGPEFEWAPDLYDAWAHGIVALIRDPARWVRMADAGRAHARNFTWDKIAAQYEGFLGLAIDRAAGRTRR